jgi:hypothetical protein
MHKGGSRDVDRRKIVLLDAADHVIKELDVSEVEHASIQAAMHIEVRTRCDMGDWHATQRLELYPWGRSIKR